MSQMRIFFLLTMIVGLCCIIECGSVWHKRGYSTAAKENGHDANTKNSPRRHESCYYPYRSNKPQNCYYSILFGNCTEGDKLVLDEEYSKPNNGARPLIVEIGFDSKTYGTITYIYVEDSKQSKRIWDDTLTIVEGGIGDKNVKLIIKSYYSDPPKYRVAIYAKKN